MSFCKERILEAKKNIDEQFSFMDEKVSNLRIENGKHSFDLIKKTEELTKDLNRIDNIINEVDNKLKEELNKYKQYNNNLMGIFESQKDEFKAIKVRFIQLSEYIRDVRFMKNLINNKKGNNIKEFDSYSFKKNTKLLSKKLNFEKPQKLTQEEENKFNIQIENTTNSYENNIKSINNSNTIVQPIAKDGDFSIKTNNPRRDVFLRGFLYAIDFCF